MRYQIIATLPAGKKKSLSNRSEEVVISYVVSFLKDKTIAESWGKNPQVYQVLDLRIYETEGVWDRKQDGPLENFIKGKRNCYFKYKKIVERLFGTFVSRIFIIMPIQGKKIGSQEDQRIYKEYDSRYECLRKILLKYGCVAIRIDKEHPLEQLVASIKQEIKDSIFIIADLTDERPSCYFEAGYAEGLGKSVIYIASEDSVINTKIKTKIHFDIHMTVNFFTNLEELASKITETIEKNRSKLFPSIDYTKSLGITTFPYTHGTIVGSEKK
jgi:hypothetical protein